MDGINCPTPFYYVLVPGIVLVSSSCCYLLFSEKLGLLAKNLIALALSWQNCKLGWLFRALLLQFTGAILGLKLHSSGTVPSDRDF